MSTGEILVISLMALAALWAWREQKTLSNDIPGDHITAVIRRAWKAEPGAFLLFAGAFCYFMGHLFWCECP